MKKVFRILFVEDIPTDVELILREFSKNNILVDHTVAEDKVAFTKALKEYAPDAVISDYSLPTFNAIMALEIRNEICPEVPFILATGAQTEEVAAECIKKGADDYILKDSLTRIPTAALNAIQKRSAEEASAYNFSRLKRNEEKFRNLFQNSLVGMFRADLDKFMFLDTNDTFNSIFSDNRPDSLKGLFREEQHYTLFRDKLLKNKYLQNFELKLASDQGNEVFLSVSCRIYETEQIIEGAIVDISENRRYQEKLEELNRQLESFVYHVSHDLKAPLQSQMNLIESAGSMVNNSEELNLHLQMIGKTNSRMYSLINDLLELARLNDQKPMAEPIDFEKEVTEALQTNSYHDNYGKINISTNINTSAGIFTNDPVRFRAVLNNLLSNAVKYHSLPRDAYINIDIDIRDHSATVSVADNGEGIPPEEENKIFEMFYKGQSASDSSGLGLYIVKNCIQGMGGKLNLYSEPGKGANFVVSIPNKTAKEQLQSHEYDSSFLSNDKKVL